VAQRRRGLKILSSVCLITINDSRTKISPNANDTNKTPIKVGSTTLFFPIIIKLVFEVTKVTQPLQIKTLRRLEGPLKFRS